MFRILTFRSEGAFWPGADSSAKSMAGRPRGMLGRAVSAISAELSARRAARTLASMDERMLRDIGIARDQIWYAARHGRESMRRSIDRRTDVTRWM